MIGLAVRLNGKRLTVAGAEDLCVLNTIVAAGGELGASTARIGERRRVHLHLSVGGLTRRAKGTTDEHLRWISVQPLRVGDRISIEIVRTDKPDKHKSATTARNNGRRLEGTP
jgi:hypothetical protein